MPEPICEKCNDVLDHQDPEYCESCFHAYEVGIYELIAQRNDLKARVAELEAALKALLWDCPRGLECNDMHHAKPDWHNGDQPCKPLDRYRQAIDNAEAIFNK